MAQNPNKIGVIYKITNLITKKSYIGQSINIKKRLREHFNWSNAKSYIDKSIRKYGKNNFSYEIICSSLNFDYVDELEIYFIDKFNTLSPNGYNLHLGGQANRIVSEETRKKLSLTKLGKIPWNKGKKATSEAIKNQSLAHIGQKSNFKGKKHTEEVKKYIYDIQKGKEKPNKQKSVIATNILTNEIKVYKKIIDAEKDGFENPNISACCKGKRLTHKGFTWRYLDVN
jgi:group I intron endonuclease